MSEEATPSAGSPDVADAAPAVSFLDTLPEDLRGEPSLRNFTDVGALAKSYTHAQRMIGGDKIGKPQQCQRLNIAPNPTRFQLKTITLQIV